jgi:hypothetical protein
VIGQDRRIGREQNGRAKAEQPEGLTGLRNLSAETFGRRLIDEFIALRIGRIGLEGCFDVHGHGVRRQCKHGAQQAGQSTTRQFSR